MNKTTNQYINQLNLDPKKEAAVRKLVENAGGVYDSTPLVENLVGNELIPIKQNGENKAVSVEQIKNEVINNGVIELPSKYEFVDLGLPSGTKWATCNIGASKPEETGLYFAWGETEGYTAEGYDLYLPGGDDTAEDVPAGKKAFTWDDYKFGTRDNLTKYNSTDGLTQLELIDDAAYQSDNNCRMPTRDEIEEFMDNTTSTWETLNGIKGKRFTSKINDNSVFVPAAGGLAEGLAFAIGSNGTLWSSSPNKTILRNGWVLNFFSDEIYVTYHNRNTGYPIRPVQDANVKTKFDIKELQSTVDSIEIQTKDAKEIFIITSDMFEQTAADANSILTFTDEGWSDFIGAAEANKIMALDYIVSATLIFQATPMAEIINTGYFILTGFNYNQNNGYGFLSWLFQTEDSPAVYVITFSNKNVTSTVINTPSEIYYLDPNTYSTPEDFNNLKDAVDNNKLIAIIEDSTLVMGTIASKSESSILMTLGLVFPDYYVMDNPAIQYGAYNFKSDGTVNKLEPKMLTFETTKDGTKFLADDGSYKEVGPYIWDETTSETIFNELKEVIEAGRRIIHHNYRECFEWKVSDTEIELRFIDNKQNRGGNYIVYIITSTSITTKYIDTGYRLDEYSTTLSPNIYHKLANVGTNTNYTFKTLNKYYNDEINEYQGEFSFGDTLYTITFPDTVKWSTDSVLEYKANHTYQFRIVNNLGVMKEFANS